MLCFGVFTTHKDLKLLVKYKIKKNMKLKHIGFFKQFHMLKVNKYFFFIRKLCNSMQNIMYHFNVKLKSWHDAQFHEKLQMKWKKYIFKLKTNETLNENQFIPKKVKVTNKKNIHNTILQK